MWLRLRQLRNAMGVRSLPKLYVRVLTSFVYIEVYILRSKLYSFSFFLLFLKKTNKTKQNKTECLPTTIRTHYMYLLPIQRSSPFTRQTKNEERRTKNGSYHYQPPSINPLRILFQTNLRTYLLFLPFFQVLLWCCCRRQQIRPIQARFAVDTRIVPRRPEQRHLLAWNYIYVLYAGCLQHACSIGSRLRSA